MEPIEAIFEIVRIDDKTWDVVILADNAVLKSFIKVYDNLFYVEESVFDRQPAVIAPDFPNQLQAMAWKEYWISAFRDPDKACKNCPTVHKILNYIEESRQKS